MEPTKPFRIFIADDDFEDLEFFRFLFDGHPDFEIVGCVASGSEIINRISNMFPPPDILLTDYMMPIISGTDAIKHLQKHHIASDMEIFIISGVDDRRLKEEFADHGHIGFLKKPHSLVEYHDLPDVILENLGTASGHRI